MTKTEVQRKPKRWWPPWRDEKANLKRGEKQNREPERQADQLAIETFGGEDVLYMQILNLERRKAFLLKKNWPEEDGSGTQRNPWSRHIRASPGQTLKDVLKNFLSFLEQGNHERPESVQTALSARRLTTIVAKNKVLVEGVDFNADYGALRRASLQ